MRRKIQRCVPCQAVRMKRDDLHPSLFKIKFCDYKGDCAFVNFKILVKILRIFLHFLRYIRYLDEMKIHSQSGTAAVWRL